MSTIRSNRLATLAAGLVVPMALGQSGGDAPCDGVLLNPDDAQFTRPGLGYLGDENGLHVYRPDEMRRKWELSCSAGNVEILTGELLEGPDAFDATPW